MKKLRRWLHEWRRRRKGIKYKHVSFVDSLRDVPEHLDKTIFIVGGKTKMKWAVFACPNHNETRVEVNLMKTKVPNWKIELAKGRVSLWPSVVVLGPCHCHFWLEKNVAFLV